MFWKLFLLLCFLSMGVRTAGRVHGATIPGQGARFTCRKKGWATPLVQILFPGQDRRAPGHSHEKCKLNQGHLS